MLAFLGQRVDFVDTLNPRAAAGIPHKGSAMDLTMPSPINPVKYCFPSIKD
jgi:hypothetical protein